MDIIFEIGMLVIFAGLGTYIAKLTRQPLVPAYVIAGIIVGKLLGSSGVRLIHQVACDELARRVPDRRVLVAC